MKCDEEKPHCRRCTGSGRECEGYPQGRQSAPTSVDASPEPHAVLFASPAERRSFFYFQSQACKPLGGYFNSSFWGREVLQAAIHYPPVRHLVIAIGSAYEAFETGTLGKETAFTLQQCNQSIRQLTVIGRATDLPSAEATSCILTASLLFIYLASIRGNLAEAFQHVRSAAKLLQDFERSTALAQKPDSAATPGYPVPIPRLRSLLAAIYGQLRGIVNDTYLEAGSPDILVTDVKPATVFPSIQDAHSYVETLLNNTMAYLQASEYLSSSSPDALQETVARHRKLCEALESSQNALDVLARTLPETGDSPDREGTAILRVYHLMIAIWLRIDIFRPGERETVYDNWEAHYEEMLRHCEFVVKKQQESRSPYSCSSGLGYIRPLHMVAARCRNSRLRWRATELLISCTRREGLWDAKLAGQIAAQTIRLEEQAANSLVTDNLKVPADKRIREVKFELQGEKAAVVRFITVDDWKKSRPGLQKAIEF